MRRLAIVAVTIALAIPILRAGTQAPPAAAQVTRIVEGAYRVDDYTVDGKPQPKIAKKIKPLYLKANGNYIWAGYHAPYRISGTTIDLDCQPVSGVISLQVRPFIITTTEIIQGSEGFKETHETRFVYLGPYEAFRPAEEPSVDDCKWKHHTRPRGSGAGSATARATRGPLVAGLQAQAPAPAPGERRGVNGQVLLAIGGAADVDLWTCIVEGGYPNVEIRERGGTPREISVFPGGRFRADLRGGVWHEWAFLISECTTAARQPDPLAELRPGPELRPATEEKVVLGCYVTAGALGGCRGWWLIRPE
jgi:hypothetical protein